MPHLPAPTKLDRLDIPGRGGLWKLKQRLRSHESRRKEFGRAILDMQLDESERLAQMRTLVDIGLWGDHPTEKDMEELFDNNKKSLWKRALHETMLLFADVRWTLTDHQVEYKRDRRMLGFNILVALNNGTLNKDVLHLALEAGMDRDWREQNNYDDTFLTRFARTSNKELFMTMLKAGADMELKDTCNDTALKILVGKMGQDNSEHIVEMADAMLAAGCNINSPGKARRFANGSYATPLHSVIDKSAESGIEWLIGNGADINAVDSIGNSYSHYLARQKTSDANRLAKILGVSIDPNIKNNQGHTPLWTAAYLKNLEMLEVLINTGGALDVRPTHIIVDHADPDKRVIEGDGKTVLQLLIEACEPEDQVRAIIQKIEDQHPNCWEWTVSNPGREDDLISVAEWVLKWYPAFAAMAECHQLLRHTPEVAPDTTRKGLRL